MAPASAGRFTFDSSPDSGPPGTVVSVSSIEGNLCDGPDVVIQIVNETTSLVQVTLESDGSWEGHVTIPSDAAPGEYEIDAHCDEGDDDGFDYAPNTFTVTGSAPTTTTTTTTVPVQPQATTTTTVAPVVVAPAAAPVVAEPATAG